MTTPGEHREPTAAQSRAADRPRDGPRNAREQRKSFRREIQGLRALGLMLVFTAHAELPFGEGGFVGLDTFFVMSGS